MNCDLGVTRPQRILGLHSSNGMHGVRLVQCGGGPYRRRVRDSTRPRHERRGAFNQITGSDLADGANGVIHSLQDYQGTPVTMLDINSATARRRRAT